MLASFAFMAASAVAYGTLCVLDNKRRDARGDKDAHTAVLQGELRGNNEDDLTDVQNRYCEYWHEVSSDDILRNAKCFCAVRYSY